MNHLSRAARKAFFGFFGDGPWSCDVCGEEVYRTETDRRRKLDVHHADGNRRNNAMSNLKATHHGCHIQRHMHGNTNTKGMRLPCPPGCGCGKHFRTSPSAETRAKMSIAQQLRWHPRHGVNKT